MKCPVCGAEQPVGMAYCDQCGSPLESEAPVADPGGASQTSMAVAPAVASVSPPAVDTSATSTSNAGPVVVPTNLPPDPAPHPIIKPTPPDTTVVPNPVDATGDMTGDNAELPPLPAGQLILMFASGSQYVCQTDVVNIGRADAAQDWHPELDVIPFGGGLPEMGVSRHHARILQQDGQFLLLDVGSTNGTYVNGTVLQYNSPTELKDGDTVAFGAFNARVVVRR